MADKKKLLTPDFRDVSKEAVQRALSNVRGGKSTPLTPPADARAWSSKKGSENVEWPESVTITAAFRGVSKNGLMEVNVHAKVRQSDEPKNNGKMVYSRFYYNNGENISEGHTSMNETTMGVISGLLVATELMPASGTLKASLLAKMFPEKGKPGDPPSPLVGKSVIANVKQETEPSKDLKTGKLKKAADGSQIMFRKDSASSFLPDAVEADDADDTEE